MTEAGLNLQGQFLNGFVAERDDFLEMVEEFLVGFLQKGGPE
jgi:hypothetical protein